MKRYGGFKLASVAMAIATLGLAGCGSGDSAPPVQVVAAPDTSGNVIKAAVGKAKVILDKNDDGIFSSDEPSVYSDDVTGGYKFPALGSHAVRAEGGIDTETLIPLLGQLRAPKGSTVVTALTTLVAANLPANPTTAEVTAAQTNVETQLGLPAGSTKLDPVAAIATNPAIEKSNAAVAMLLENSAKTVASFSGINRPASTATAADQKKYSDAVSAISADAAKAVASTLKAQTATLNLSTATAANVAAFVEKAIAQTVTQVQTSVATSTSAVSVAMKAASTADVVANIKNTSAANVAAFVAPSVSQAVTAISQVDTSNATTAKAAIVAATKQVQQSTLVASAIENIKTQAPTLFTATATAAPEEMKALAEVMLPAAQVISNSAVTVDTAKLTTALTAAATTAKAPEVTAVVAAIVTQVTASLAVAPPPPPAAVVIRDVVVTTLPPLPPPETVTITGAL